MNGSPDGFHLRTSWGSDAAAPAGSSHATVSALHYVVASREGHWWILYNGKSFGRTRAFASALREAVGSAREAGLQGFDARVFVEYDSGYRRHVWSCRESTCPLDTPRRIQRRRSP